MKKFTIVLALSLMAFFMSINESYAQIWEPEGLNMPGAWNSWNNPPTNNMALASYTQVPGGQIIKINNGLSARWHTMIHVAAAGGDVVGGTSGQTHTFLNTFCCKYNAIYLYGTD